MKRILYLIILCFSLSSALFAQRDINIGKIYNIHSSVLNEDRSYWLYLPPNYDNADYGKASYPVIYLLDGDKNFHMMVGIQKTYTKGLYNNMPECIIVGVPNTDRSRDLTPSKGTVIRDGQALFDKSGGSDNFTTFLIDELKAEINTKYRTSGYDILVGHSFGGLYAMNTLVHRPLLFNAYVVIDPSLWWDNRKVFNEAQEIWKNADFKGRSLYIAMAQNEDRPDDTEKHSNTIDEFCNTVLNSAPENGLRAMWKYYPTENHGTVLMAGVYDAFRSVFDGIELPVKKLPKNPEIIGEQYKQLSKQLGHTFIPDESLVDNIGKYALSIKNEDGAIRIFEYNVRNYPDSYNALNSLSIAYDKKGDAPKAEEYKRKALNMKAAQINE